MKTDLAFAELFSRYPGWFLELTGLDLPEPAVAEPYKFKGVEREADLVIRPKDPGNPYFVVEFQMQLDNRIFNRANLYRALLWDSLLQPGDGQRKGFRPPDVRAIVVFGTEALVPEHWEVPEKTTVLFLDGLLEVLEARDPGSPSLPVFAPLTLETSELEKKAQRYYGEIQDHPKVDGAAKELLLSIFEYFLYQHFDSKTEKNIRAMIAKLTPLQETRAGKDLIQEGYERGVEKREREIILSMNANGMTVEQIMKATDLPKGTVLGHLEAE